MENGIVGKLNVMEIENKPKGKPRKKSARRVGDMPAIDTIAIELKRAREAKDISLSDLNRLTGISRTVLFGYEGGRTKPGAREIRLLAEALEVNPNRLLFGTDEPFSPGAGLSTLVKLRQSPAIVMVSLIPLLPIILAVLDDEQIKALVTMIGSMIEARNKEEYVRISSFIEVMAKQIGQGTADDLAKMQERANDPDFIKALNDDIEEKIAKSKKK